MRQSVNAVRKERPDIFQFLKGDLPLHEIFDLPSHLSEERIKIYKDAYNDIGNTPIYTISLGGNDNYLHTKLEYKNQCGSNHYSRYWFIYFFIAETLELIEPNRDEILEVTSGSSGIALSQACNILGYKLTLFVPNLISSARLRAIEGKNIDVIISNGYIDQCIQDFKSLRDKDKFRFFTPNHAEEKSDIILDVFKRIATEFHKQYKGIPDCSILALGNGTSAKAVMQYFLSKNQKKALFYGYQPDLKKVNLNPILGLRPPNVDFRHIDNYLKNNMEITYTDELELKKVKEKYRYDDEISRFGITSLYAVAVALKYAKKVKGTSFFSIAYDTIEMYE